MADKALPSVAAIAIGAGLIALIAGYFLGQASSIGLFGGSGSRDVTKKSWPNNYDVTVHADSSDGDSADEEAEDKNDSGSKDDMEELKSFDNTSDEVKLVLCVRTDLAMGKGRSPSENTLYPRTTRELMQLAGKIAAQCSHATLACYKYLVNHPPSAFLLRRWEQGGQPKITLQVKNEEELITLQAQAISLGLCTRTIQDAGRTQIAAGSTTVLGILGPKRVVDQVSGHLKLL